ncbi:MAG: hypothetical protein JXR76_06200 [Deltaproteobacteria bacterium]|nr:hypothetical protein [Deltaproteobacteria bacterium]
MTKYAAGIFVLFCVGCVPSYQSRSEMPDNLQDNLNSVEVGYLSKAASAAARITGCSARLAQKQILTTRREKFMIQYPTADETPVFLTDERITSIGVSICEEELTFNVTCGADDEYAALIFEYPITQFEKKSSCQVVPKK